MLTSLDIPIISLVCFLWCSITLMLLQQWIMPLKTLPAAEVVFIIILTFLLAPSLLITDVFMTFLDWKFPEGWQDGEWRWPK